jgi:hypothetical protein
MTVELQLYYFGISDTVHLLWKIPGFAFREIGEEFLGPMQNRIS